MYNAKWEDWCDCVTNLQQQIDELKMIITDCMETIDIFLEEGDRDELVAFKKYMKATYKEGDYGNA